MNTGTVPFILGLIVGTYIVSVSVISTLRSKHGWGFKAASLSIYTIVCILFIHYSGHPLFSGPITFLFIAFVMLFLVCYYTWQNKRADSDKNVTNSEA